LTIYLAFVALYLHRDSTIKYIYMGRIYRWQCLCLLLISFGNTYAQQHESGYASFYADRFHGKKTASGEAYNKNGYTAAHRTLPFGTTIKVTRVDNNKTVVVRINDRGPFVKGRIIDLSRAAARELDLIQEGTAMVKLQILKKGSFTEAPLKLEEMSEDTRIPPSPTTASERGMGLFHMDAFRAHKEGFGIQLAAYAKFQNAIEAVSELQRKKERKTMIHVMNNRGKTVFRLILGPFESRNEAEIYRRRLSKNKTSGIIVDLSKLK